MQSVNGSSLLNLVTQVSSLTTQLQATPTLPILTPIPILIPIPIHLLSVTTTLMRGGNTIGYVITSGGFGAPTSASVTMGSGVLWLQASLFGAPFASTPGFTGIPFASGTLKATGSATFGGGKIVLDAAATLAFTIQSSVSPVTGPAGDPVGQDFLAAKLTPFGGAVVTLAPAGASIALTGSSSATIYGQSLSLTPAPTPTLAELDFTEPHVALSCNIAQTTFAVASSASPEIVFAGKAPIVGAGVVFPVYNVAPTALPQPADAWGIVIVTGPGLSATVAPLTAPLALAGSSFALTPARLVGLVANGPTRARETYLLWTTPPAPSPLPATQPEIDQPPSQITLDLAPGSVISFSSAPDQEITIAQGNLIATLDRPLDANGHRLNLQGAAIFTRTHTATSIKVGVGSALTPGAKTSLAIMAENALVPIATPNGFLLSGTLNGNVITGGLAIISPASYVVPAFPDPYAAAYDGVLAQGYVSGVVAGVDWNAGPPTTAMTILHGTANANANLEGVSFVSVRGTGSRLLDVSGNADQWGIAMAATGEAQASFAGLVLQAPSASTAVFTVPGISWEPVVDTVGVPGWLAAASPDDGTPTIFLVAVNKPAAILPVETLLSYQTAAGTTPARANFTLPFGIKANLADPATSGTTGPSYKIPTPAFPDQNLIGARTLSITAAPSPPLEATLPGSAICGYDTSSPAYGAKVLGVALPSVASFWDQDFGTGATAKGYMPVSRIDLSGYGTSMFSDWHDPSLTDVGIIRALFNVLLGRTAHEIVTAQTWIVPWCIRLQRTITFDRSDAGEVIKHDTGWVAVAPGKFEQLQGPPSRILAGPVTSLNNVRDIQFSSSVADTVTVGGITYSPCTFEADVAFASAINISANGKNPAPTVVCTGIQGYADDTVTSLNTQLNAAAIIALMQKVGRVAGKTSCVARVGGTGKSQFAMTAASIGAAIATGPTPMLQTAIFGTPQLPKDGQWSVARRLTGSKTPVPVAAGTPVPLTQGTTAGATPPPGPGTFAATCFRLLDPEDAQSVDAPQTFYGILQGTGTSKTLFEHPLINNTGSGFGFGNVPGLADAGALLGIAGVFPDIGNVLKIPANQGGLPFSTDGFVKTYTLGAAASPPDAQPPDRALLDIAVVHLVLAYAANGTEYSGKLVLDATPSAPNWSITLSNLSFEAKVDGMGADPLLSVTGGFQAGSAIKPGFTDLKVNYGSALSAVKDLMTGLSDLASSLGGDAELNVGFSGNTLTVQQGFTLPTIPLGFGEIQNLGIHLGFSATIPSSLGFSVGIGSVEDPFQWLVSPLAGTGAIVLGVKDGNPDVYIEAGLGLGLSISVAVASGSASIVIALSLDVGTDVTIAVTLTGTAEVDVLGGLASASLTLSASITVTIEASPHQADLAAQCAVGIHISICWVISISFDGSWGFSETIALS